MDHITLVSRRSNGKKISIHIKKIYKLAQRLYPDAPGFHYVANLHRRRRILSGPFATHDLAKGFKDLHFHRGESFVVTKGNLFFKE